MRLPISFNQFSRDPVKGFLFIVLLAVGYLYYDNKTAYKNQMVEQRGQISTCASRVQILEDKLDKQSVQLKKSDSILAIAIVRLGLLKELDKEIK